MRKILNLCLCLSLIFLFAFSLYSCVPEDDTPKGEDPDVSVSVQIIAQDTAVITEGDTLDVKSLFEITVDGNSVAVTDGMISLGGFTPNDAKVGEYTVTLTYTSAVNSVHTKSVKITVLKKAVPPVDVMITSQNLTVNTEDAFDIKEMFEISADGVSVAVTDEMLTLGTFSPENPKSGTYTITLKYISADGVTHTKRAYLTVVSDNGSSGTDPEPPKQDPVVVVIKSENTTVKTDEKLDVKSLFEIIADGIKTEVTNDMLSLGGLNPENLEVGVYEITLTYEAADDTVHTKTATVTVEERVILPDPVTVVLTAKNIEVMSESPIDVKSLFTVTANGVKVEVTDAMLSLGTLNPDYPMAGTYTVKLTYIASDGVVHTKTATVTVNPLYVGPF